MRIAVSEIKQEGNTFTPIPATIQDFQKEHILEGQEIIPVLRNTNTEIWGFIDQADKLGYETIPLFAASALSGGVLTRETYLYLQERLISNLKNFLPVDGVYLALHGAMCADIDGGEDASGILLERVRNVVGEQVPIIATLDLHANVTRKMVEFTDGLVGYRTWPHVDQYDRGKDAADLMASTLERKVTPTTALSKLKMILQVENGQTSSGPMGELIYQVEKMIRNNECLSGSVFLVQPWLDLPEMGCAVIFVCDDDNQKAKTLADNLAKKMWAIRDKFSFPLMTIDEAIDLALETPCKTTILADVADSTGSGTPGDSTAILEKLLEKKIDAKCFLPIVDFEAVEIALQEGEGAEVQLYVGAKHDQTYYKPVWIKARVEWIGKGVSFNFAGPVFKGLKCEMGDVVVLRVRDIHILVTRWPVWTYDPEMYRTVGLEPGEATIVVVKSQNTFRPAYEDIADQIITVDAPGFSPSNVRKLEYEKIPRPFFPFDTDWEGAPW